MSSKLKFLKGEGILVSQLISEKKSYIKSLVAALLSMLLLGVGVGWGQTTVTYTIQTSNFNTLHTERNNIPPFAGTYNQSATEIGQYANGGSFGNTPGAAAFQTFTTSGAGSGTARTLRVGDKFTITGFVSANPSAGGYIGVSFRASTTYSNFFSATDNNTVARFQLDNTGNWKVYSGSSVVATSSSGANADRTFSIEITSANTFNATIGSETFYDLSFGATGPISSFAIYSFGDSNPNSFWKNASLTNFGHTAGDGIRLGYDMVSGNTRTISGIISDGLNTNTTSGSLVNKVLVGGASGSQLNLNTDNTYTGSTTINANAQGEVQHANALGATTSGTTVTSGGSLKIYSASGITVAAEPLTLNGVGLASNSLGALRSTGGNNIWTGDISLGSNSRINADATGASGGLTISGNISAGSNVLFLGTKTGSVSDISISGTISGSGATQIGTTTSLFKDGSNTLTLSGSNSYTGDTRITAGTLTVAAGGSLGSGSDIFISSGATLNINNSCTVASLQETGTNNGGVVAIASGQTLTINGSDKGTFFQNSISGAGSLTMAGTGTTNLSLYGSQSYTGTTTISGGKIYSAVSLSSTNYVITGGVLELDANNIVPNTADFEVSGGTLLFDMNQTIDNLIVSGGVVTIASGKTLTINGKLSITPNATITGNIAYGANASLEITGSGTTSNLFWPTTSSPTNIIINTSGNVNLHAARTITGTLTLTNGKLVLGSNNLTIESGGSINGSNTSKYIVTDGSGKLIINNVTSAKTFPVGNAKYNPLIIDNNGGLNWSISVSDGVTPNVGFSDAGAVLLVWDITPSSTPTATNITFQYDATASTGQVGGSYSTFTNGIQAFKRNRYDEYWFPVGNPGTPTNDNTSTTTVQINNLTSFSKYALSKVGSPLPVTFTSLSGRVIGGQAHLTWNVAQEIDVDHYEVEESVNGRQFHALTQVDAASRSSYQAVDVLLHPGANYYRVKAVDLDGKLTYSKVIRLDNSSRDSDVRIYPNPTRGEVNLALSGLPADTYILRVVSPLGQVVYQQSLPHDGGSRSLPLSLNNLPAGIYQVQLSGGTTTITRKLKIEQ